MLWKFTDNVFFRSCFACLWHPEMCSRCQDTGEFPFITKWIRAGPENPPRASCCWVTNRHAKRQKRRQRRHCPLTMLKALWLDLFHCSPFRKMNLLLGLNVKWILDGDGCTGMSGQLYRRQAQLCWEKRISLYHSFVAW